MRFCLRFRVSARMSISRSWLYGKSKILLNCKIEILQLNQICSINARHLRVGHLTPDHVRTGLAKNRIGDDEIYLLCVYV